MTEIYKIVNDIAPPIVNSLFEYLSNLYNLRNFQDLSTDKRNTVIKSWKCEIFPCRICIQYQPKLGFI